MALEKRFDKSLGALVGSLKEIAQTKKTVDLGYLVTLFTFDTLGEVGFSQTFGLLENGTDINGIVHVVQKTTPLLIAFSHVPSLVKMVRSTVFKRIFGQPAGVRYLEAVR